MDEDRALNMIGSVLAALNRDCGSLQSLEAVHTAGIPGKGDHLACGEGRAAVDAVLADLCRELLNYATGDAKCANRLVEKAASVSKEVGGAASDVIPGAG